MAVEIPIYYDFASTICCVADRVLRRWQPQLSALGVSLRWRPFDLARVTGWPRGAEVDDERRANALRVAEEFGVGLTMPRCWLDSRAAHAISLSLGDPAKEEAWRERVWTAAFDESRDIGETAEIERLAADLDLVLDVGPADLAGVDRATREAYEAGITGVPTLDLGGWFLPGLQDEKTTLLVLERYLRRRVA